MTIGQALSSALSSSSALGGQPGSGSLVMNAQGGTAPRARTDGIPLGVPVGEAPLEAIADAVRSGALTQDAAGKALTTGGRLGDVFYLDRMLRDGGAKDGALDALRDGDPATGLGEAAKRYGAATAGYKLGEAQAVAKWGVDVAKGAVAAARTAGEAAVSGAERGPLGGLVPDGVSDATDAALKAKGEALLEQVKALPDMPAKMVESYEARFALADKLEGAYLDGYAEIGVYAEAFRIRGEAAGELKILAAEAATTVIGVGAGVKALKTAGGVARAPDNSKRADLHSLRTADMIREGHELITRSSVDAKLKNYTLNPDHPRGGDKAKNIEIVLGYTKANHSKLSAQIKFNIDDDVVVGSNEYGTLYRQYIQVEGVNGKKASLLTGWIDHSDHGTIMMTTAYLKDAK